LRSAFTDLRIVREQIIADGNFLAARTTFSGDDGRLAEEWVQTDYRSLLTKLGVTTTESAERSR
jgi:hypothetical protein